MQVHQMRAAEMVGISVFTYVFVMLPPVVAGFGQTRYSGPLTQSEPRPVPLGGAEGAPE
jgi:hypothetical protein